MPLCTETRDLPKPSRNQTRRKNFHLNNFNIQNCDNKPNTYLVNHVTAPQEYKQVFHQFAVHKVKTGQFNNADMNSFEDLKRVQEAQEGLAKLSGRISKQQFCGRKFGRKVFTCPRYEKNAPEVSYSNNSSVNMCSRPYQSLPIKYETKIEAKPTTFNFSTSQQEAINFKDVKFTDENRNNVYQLMHFVDCSEEQIERIIRIKFTSTRDEEIHEGVRRGELAKDRGRVRQHTCSFIRHATLATGHDLLQEAMLSGRGGQVQLCRILPIPASSPSRSSGSAPPPLSPPPASSPPTARPGEGGEQAGAGGGGRGCQGTRCPHPEDEDLLLVEGARKVSTTSTNTDFTSSESTQVCALSPHGKDAFCSSASSSSLLSLLSLLSLSSSSNLCFFT
ncbi:myelin transcription factor 1-like protein [Caerostris extrusa]|uniref:Myelin transcription factor 1-like protein n=1 Tax=Caerostris extrusa TaxID=172846 RepID=A0AAV4NDP3_CAEEX|nr:myelin transcription factor 1-like protein [Caerostris extrusa]